MFSNFGDLMEALQWGALIVFALVLVAAVYQKTIDAANGLFNIVAQTVAVVARALWAAVGNLRQVIATARSHLAYEPDGTFREPSTWDVVGPVGWLIVHAVVLVGEFALSVLTFGALFGLSGASNPPFMEQLDTMTGLLWGAVILSFGLALFELLGLSPLRRPYGFASGRTRRVLLIVSIAGIALSIVAMACFYLWRQSQVGDGSGDVSRTIFLVLFATLVVAALVISGWAFLVGLGVVKVLFFYIVRAIAAVIAATATLLFRGVDAGYRALVAIVGIPAGLGRTLWNWFARGPVGEYLRLAEIPEAEIPDLAADGSPILSIGATDPGRWTRETSETPSSTRATPKPARVASNGHKGGRVTASTAARAAGVTVPLILAAMILMGAPVVTLTNAT